jgi:hypothetical protein
MGRFAARAALSVSPRRRAPTPGLALLCGLEAHLGKRFSEIRAFIPNSPVRINAELFGVNGGYLFVRKIIGKTFSQTNSKAKKDEQCG